MTTELWEEYLQDRSLEKRNSLIEEHWSLVRSLAYKVYQRTSNYSVDDLEAYGSIGLIEAIERFDPEKGKDFIGYASIRIRGAMIDAIRDMDWVPRSIRIKAKDLDEARQELHVELRRTPTFEELADHLGMTMQELAKLETSALITSIHSLDAPLGEDGSFHEMIAEPEIVNVFEDRTEELKEVFYSLEPRYQAVLILMYLEGLNVSEIAILLGMGDSRISQMHSSAIEQITEGSN